MVFCLAIRLMPDNRFYLNVIRQTRRLSVRSSVNMAAFVVNTGETGKERDGFQVFTASDFRGLRSEETGAVKMRQRTEIFSRVKERKYFRHCASPANSRAHADFAGRGEPDKFRRPSERKAVAHGSGLPGGHSPAHRRG